MRILWHTSSTHFSDLIIFALKASVVSKYTEGTHLQCNIVLQVVDKRDRIHDDSIIQSLPLTLS